jgi:hypothetical protein
MVIPMEREPTRVQYLRYGTISVGNCTYVPVARTCYKPFRYLRTNRLGCRIASQRLPLLFAWLAKTRRRPDRPRGAKCVSYGRSERCFETPTRLHPSITYPSLLSQQDDDDIECKLLLLISPPPHSDSYNREGKKNAKG